MGIPVAHDRRTWARVVCSSQREPCVARVRSGHEARIVNLSAGGVLLETAVQLMPGAVIDLRLMSDGRVEPARGRVVRCFVHEVRPESVRYRAGIAFERRVAALGAGLCVSG